MEYILEQAILIGIYSILAMSLNYIAGYAGILSIAQGAFFGVGAYTTAILMSAHGIGFITALIAAIIVTLIVAVISSYFILKLKDDSLMLVSFGFAIIIFNLFQNLKDLTGGALGINRIPAPEIFGINFGQGNREYFAALVLIFVILTYLFFRRITKTTYGRVLKGIRENELVMQNTGHDTSTYKHSAFIIGSTIAAVAGALFATNSPNLITPMNFQLMESVTILIIIITGGFGNMKGSILGTIIVLLIPDLFEFIGLRQAELPQIFYGLLLISLMYFRPQGLLGKYKI